MLDGRNADVALTEYGTALCFNNVLSYSLDNRLAFELLQLINHILQELMADTINAFLEDYGLNQIIRKDAGLREGRHRQAAGRRCPRCAG